MKGLLFAIVAVCCASLILGATQSVSDENVESYKEFMTFLATHNKKYDNAEFWNRFEVFKNNKAKIEKLNRESMGATYALNQFADMSEEEFKTYPCGVKNLADMGPGAYPSKNAEMKPLGMDLPTEFDWTTKGAVNPIKNQGQCGSCWAFSTVGNTEGVWFLAGNDLVSLSEQQVVDCSTQDYGCGGGWPMLAFQDMLRDYSGGFDSEKSYPYTAANGECQFNSQNVAATVKDYTNWCNATETPCPEEQIQEHLVKHGPLSACLNAESMQFYSGGVDNPSGCDPSSIDHCIVIVGYGEDSSGTPFWKIRNSWGTSWGEDGYYRLKRGDGLCGINKVITTAVV